MGPSAEAPIRGAAAVSQLLEYQHAGIAIRSADTRISATLAIALPILSLGASALWERSL